MRIRFLGAAREVTGSLYLVETATTKILVDCGMHQGCNTCDVKNIVDFPFDPKEIDAVLLTHAHLDHSGRMPKLVKNGFKGKIYATPPTLKLAMLVIEDAQHIMEEDYEREGTPVLYSKDDVHKTEDFFEAVDYSRDVTIGDLVCRPRDAGHIFGSAFWEVRQVNGPSAAFSGDLGNRGSKILRPTAQLSAVDALIIESTYGNRIHEDESTRESKLMDILKRTIEKKGVLVIPAFSIDRTQQILFELNHLIEKGIVPQIDIYLDSPMAIKATDVMKEYPQYYNKEARDLAASGDDLFDFPGLHLTKTRDESKLINDALRPKVIIAGSGMMNGGRIQHHLVRYLTDPNSTVLIVGYQAEGTLGRELHDGKKVVRVLQETVTVKATVMSIGAYSAHADQAKLVSWIQEAEALPKHIYCTHGEEGAAVALATRIKQHFGIEAVAPHVGDSVNV
jgi:metallo-beta-lactamase family protein